MTSFNAVGAILPLDEYYKNCVHPKPLIPPRYPGAGQTRQAGHRKVGKRQAGHLRSYKDEQDSDENEDEPVGTCESDADSDFKSNMTQINYEMDDFNKNYCDESSPWQNEDSNSNQWRRHNTNNARPNGGQKSNVKSRLDLNNRWNKHNRIRNPRKNNGNTLHHLGVNQNQNRVQQQQQARIILEKNMRFAYNSFRGNNVDPSPNELLNHKYALPNIPQNPQDMGHASVVTSMTETVANLTDSRTGTPHNQSYVSYETPVQPLSSAYAAERAQVNTLPQPDTPMEINSRNVGNYTVQQVARHVMLMMSTVCNADTGETPEYFKSKKSMIAAGGESHISEQPEGFN